ncbi:hypothetical protein B0H13DRAFT_2663743, partial [Mycena leptocephala]
MRTQSQWQTSHPTRTLRLQRDESGRHRCNASSRRRHPRPCWWSGWGIGDTIRLRYRSRPPSASRSCTCDDDAYTCMSPSPNVHVVLGERVDLASLASITSDSSHSESASDANDNTTVRTIAGREIGVDLVLLCTGQTPNTSLLRALDPRVVDPVSGLARVG